MALASEVGKLQRDHATMKEQIANMEREISNLTETLKVNQTETHKLQLTLAQGQGSLKTLFIIGGGLLGLIQIIGIAVASLKR